MILLIFIINFVHTSDCQAGNEVNFIKFGEQIELSSKEDHIVCVDMSNTKTFRFTDLVIELSVGETDVVPIAYFYRGDEQSCYTQNLIGEIQHLAEAWTSRSKKIVIPHDAVFDAGTCIIICNCGNFGKLLFMTKEIPVSNTRWIIALISFATILLASKIAKEQTLYCVIGAIAGFSTFAIVSAFATRRIANMSKLLGEKRTEIVTGGLFFLGILSQKCLNQLRTSCFVALAIFICFGASFAYVKVDPKRLSRRVTTVVVINIQLLAIAVLYLANFELFVLPAIFLAICSWWFDSLKQLCSFSKIETQTNTVAMANNTSKNSVFSPNRNLEWQKNLIKKIRRRYAFQSRLAKFRRTQAQCVQTEQVNRSFCNCGIISDCNDHNREETPIDLSFH